MGEGPGKAQICFKGQAEEKGKERREQVRKLGARGSTGQRPREDEGL